MIGSTRVARRAGSQQAASATAQSTAATARVCRRISRLHAVQEFRHQPRKQQRANQSAQRSRESEQHSLTHHHPENRASLRAQRHPNSNLLRTRSHRSRQHSEKSKRRKKKCQRAVQSRQRRERTAAGFLSDASRSSSIAMSYTGKRWINRSHHSAHRARHRSGIALHSQRQHHRLIRPLRIRKIYVELRTCPRRR